MTPAPPLKRLFAFLIDALFIFIVTIALMFAIRLLFGFVALKAGTDISKVIPIIEVVESWILILTIFSYLTISNWYWGGTIGKAILGLKVVDLTGNKLSFKASTLRTLSYILTSWTYGIGFLIGLIRKDRTALHDFVSNTAVSIREAKEKEETHEGFLSFNTKSLSDTDLKPFDGA